MTTLTKIIYVIWAGAALVFTVVGHPVQALVAAGVFTLLVEIHLTRGRR